MLKSGNDVIKDAKTISDMFCTNFSKIGLNLSERIPAPENSFGHYIKHPISNQSLFMSPTDLIEITRIVMSLKPNNSSGLDGTSSKPIQTGDVPRSMKIAKMIPIHKSKDKTDMRNYRQISYYLHYQKY